MRHSRSLGVAGKQDTGPNMVPDPPIEHPRDAIVMSQAARYAAPICTCVRASSPASETPPTLRRSAKR